MAPKVVWTDAALVELEEILEFINRDSQYYAALTEERMHEAAKSLIQFPLRARVVPEFESDDIRELFVFNYRLIYRVEKEVITVLTVVHSARDISRTHKFEDS